MSHHAVRAESLSKTYRIQHPSAPHVREYFSSPFRSLRAPRSIDVEALSDVSFDVEEGEVFGIVGRNGAGKSTLLKILSRITTPTKGRATMVGRIASLLEVGTGFHPELTGRENVYLNGTLLGMSAREVDRVFDEICEFAGIGSYLDTPIKRYSSGMQLRLAFAVAAHLAADTMIIDEVLAVGDAEFQAKCTGAMREAAERGRTTLFVSHNMAAVENLCTRAVLLEKGRVVRIGPVADVVRAYLASAHASANGLEYVAPVGRSTNSLVRVSRAVISGVGGGPPVQGEDLVLVADLTANEVINKVQLSVCFSTIEGTRVATFCNGDTRQEWTLVPGTSRVTIRIRGNQLLPRTMNISLRLMRHWGAEVHDEVPDAMTFALLERDVLGRGIPLRADRGVVWMSADYRLDSPPAA